MSDLYDRIVSRRGAFENLLSRIPGYGGYMEMQTRRKADDLLRQYLVKRLEDQRQRLDEIGKSMLSSGGLAQMDELRSLMTKLRTFIDRIESAADGYSGFFSAVKIGEEELEKLYAFDDAMTEYVDGFREAIDTLEEAVNSGGDVAQALRDASRLADEANRAFRYREDVITGLTHGDEAR